MSIFNINKIHKSWIPFFTEERIKEICNIEKLIGDNYNPDSKNVFRFATNDLSQIKCVLLGQVILT